MQNGRKSDRTRSRLVEVAATVFADRGYTGARLADLVQASGLTKGAFYFHFPSKEAAAVAVLDSVHDGWLRALRERVAVHQPADRLSALVDAVLELAAAEPGSWAAFRLCVDLHGVPHLADGIRRHNEALVALVAEVLSGAAPGADPDRVRVCAIGLVGAVIGVRDLLTGLDEPDRFRAVLTALGEGALATLG